MRIRFLIKKFDALIFCLPLIVSITEKVRIFCFFSHFYIVFPKKMQDFKILCAKDFGFSHFYIVFSKKMQDFENLVHQRFRPSGCKKAF